MKGQVSVEHLVLLGVVIAILIPGIISFYGSTSEQNEQYQLSRINSIGNEIVSTADNLYLLGEDNKKTLKLDFPESFQNITIEGTNSLIITYEGSLGIGQAIFVSKAPLTTALSGSQLDEIRVGRVDLLLEERDGQICLAPPGGHCANICGNGVIDGGEACDSQNLNGQTCRDFGFNAGALVCNSQCSNFLTDFCADCLNYGTFCLDEGFETSGANFLRSIYVDDLLGTWFFGFGVEISHDWFYDWVGLPTPAWWNDVCGHNFGYKMRRGGGVLLEPIIGINNGNFIFDVNLMYDPSDSDSDFGIQCDGFVYHFPKGSGNTNTVEAACALGSNPDIRFMGHGDDFVWVEEFNIKSNCDITPECLLAHESDWHCITEGFVRDGNDITSRFVEEFEEGFGEEGGEIRWSEMLDDDAGDLDLPRYERSCFRTFFGSTLPGPQGEDHTIRWMINDSATGPLLDPVNPAGEYELLLNVIWGTDPAPAAAEIKCGSRDWVLFEPNINLRSHSYMETYIYDCTFHGTPADDIRIRSTGPGKAFYVEQLKLRKKCS